jgi:adhesin HecA-like repeat protein
MGSPSAAQLTLDDVYTQILSLRRLTSPLNNTGGVYTIQMAVGITSGVISNTVIPANAVVSRAAFRVTTPFLPATGTTMWAGVTGGTGNFVNGATASIAATAGTYVSSISVPMGGTAGALLYSVQNSPTAGAGFLTVEYAIPAT